MRLRPHFFRSFFTSVTCWLGVAVSLGLFYLVTSQIEKDSKAHFDSHTNNLLLVIEARIQSHVEILFATRAMFHANGEVTRKMFHDYVASLDLPKRFPAITTLSYAPLVLHTDKPAFESSIRNDRSVDSNGYNGFAIKSSGMRAEYHVVSYVEPMKGNRDYLGFDIASTPCGGTALALLRGSERELISSCRAASVDDTKRNAGPVIRLPLYRPGLPLAAAAERRAAFYGSIGVHFDIKRLMLDAIDGNIAPGVRLRLYDLGLIDENLPAAISDSKHLLFDSLAIPDRRADSSPIATSADSFVKRTSLEVGSHGWEIEFSAPRDAMHFGFDAYFPWLILAGGLLMSMLVYVN